MSVDFNWFYNFIMQSLKQFASANDLYALSVYLFVLCSAVGVLLFLICTLFKGARKASYRWCFTLYTLAFMTDIFICFVECEFKGVYFKKATVAYLYCFVKYMLLIALYAVILLQKALMFTPESSTLHRTPVSEEPIRKSYYDERSDLYGKGDDRALNNYRARQFSDTDSFIECKKNDLQTEKEEKIECDFSKKPLSESIIDRIVNKSAIEQTPDVNVAYLRGVIGKLKDKDLTVDEKAELEDLDLKLRQSIPSEPTGIRALNEDLLKLVKKMTKYDVTL